MKFIKLLLLFVSTGFLVISCNSEKLPDLFKIGVVEDFKTGEFNQTDNSSLKFSITEITDSRCPSDVVCVWQGEARVKIKIVSPQTDTITLGTYNNLIDTAGYYSFELIDVSPYPISTEQIELKDYIVTLKIEELQD